MSSNKKFLILAVVLAVVAFGGMGLFLKSQKTSDSSSSAAENTTVVSNDILIKFHSHVKGPQDAKVTVVEFLDPECESCRLMHPYVKQIMSEYDGKIKLVTRYMTYHPNSMYAASVLEEAKAAGKYEEALDIMFETQPIWGSHAAPRPDLIPEFMSKLGLTKEQLAMDVVIAKHKTKIELDVADGRQAGVRGTPSFFVNGKPLAEIGYDPLKSAIEKALAD